jgi:DNA-3-methyladenine glycosylase
LRIDNTLDGTNATRSRDIWIEDRAIRVPVRSVNRGPRIGVDYAGHYWAARPWRYWLASQPVRPDTHSSHKP